MAEKKSGEDEPFLQKLYDRPFVLLALCPLMHLFHGRHGRHGHGGEPGSNHKHRAPASGDTPGAAPPADPHPPHTH